MRRYDLRIGYESFHNLFNSLSTDTNKKGEQLKRITKWFLENDSWRGTGYSTRPESYNHSHTNTPKKLRRGEYPVALRTFLSMTIIEKPVKFKLDLKYSEISSKFHLRNEQGKVHYN